MNKIPSYDELKKMKSYKTYDLYDDKFGGYWRLTLNESVNMNFEENQKITNNNIALDYLEDNWHVSEPFKPYKSSTYEACKLYKFNKKNYTGLLNMYKHILLNIQSDTNNAIEE